MFTIAFIATSLVASAQVGVGTTNPLVSLQVDKSAVAAEADGVLVPRVSVADLNAKADAYVGAQNGALVFIDDLIGTAAGKTSNVVSTGFHYYDSVAMKWVSIAPKVKVPTFRISSDNIISDADFGNYIIKTTGGTTNLDQVSLVAGAVLTFIDNSPSAYSFSSPLGNLAAYANPNQSIQGTTVTWICDGSKWYNFGN